MCALGCADRPAAAPATHPALHHGPLVDYVPAAGLRWMVVGQPRKLAKSESFGPPLEAIFQRERLEAFAMTSGVDLRTAPSALVAGFDLGTLYMAELAEPSAEQVRKLFEERLISGARVKQPHPELVSVTGVVGLTPETLVTVGKRTVAVSVGDPTPARIVEAFARRRLTRSPTALRGAALSTLPDLQGAPVAFFAPGPFSESVQRAAGGLLETALAVGAAMHPLGPGRARLVIAISGDWASDPALAAEHLRAVYRTLVQSSTGALLGLDEQPEPRVHATRTLLTFEVDLDLARIARGIRAAVIADPWEIFGSGVPTSDGKSP